MSSIDENLNLHDYVSAGSFVGRMGKTGTTTCHLHLVLYQNLSHYHIENLKKGWSADYQYYYKIENGTYGKGPSMLAARFSVGVPNAWYAGRGSVCMGGPDEKNP